MYNYKKISDTLGTISLDSYNRENSELIFVEAKIVKSDEYLNVIGALISPTGNIKQDVKGNDGKYAPDPSFKLTGDPYPIVCLQLPLKLIKKTSKAGKEYTVGSHSEIFVAEKLLEDFGDGGSFEGTIDPGVDRGVIDKINAMLEFGEPGKVKAQGQLVQFYQVEKVDELTAITPEIIAQVTTAKNNGNSGKSYPKNETEAEKLKARSEFVKRFLADNWDESVDYSLITFDSCLALWDGRETVQKGDSGELLFTVLKAIMS